MQPEKPRAHMRPTDMAAFPEELKSRSAWVCWRYEAVAGKWTKVPHNARNGAKASSTAPGTWSSYQQAIAAYKRGGFDGIGIALTSGSGYVGVDLDHCVENGEIASWAIDIIWELGSYTEISPSGSGVRIFCKGSLPPGGRKKGNVEMYDGGRYLTVTGRHIEYTPLNVADCTLELAALHAKLWPPQPPTPRLQVVGRGQSKLSDQDVLRLARTAKNGRKFFRLWAGDTSDYHSRSEAHLAFCNLLSFWCGGDTAQIDRLFRASGLYDAPDIAAKWDQRHYANGDTYGQHAVELAAGRGEYFTPGVKRNAA